MYRALEQSAKLGSKADFPNTVRQDMLIDYWGVPKLVQREMKNRVEEYLKQYMQNFRTYIAYFTIPKHNDSRASTRFPVYLRDSSTHKKFSMRQGDLTRIPSAQNAHFPANYDGYFHTWNNIFPDKDLKQALENIAKRNNLALDQFVCGTLRITNGSIQWISSNNPPKDVYISYVIIATFRVPTLIELASRSVPPAATEKRLEREGYPDDLIQLVKKQRK